uniref:Uncharacterized protein n=1 Tax=Panagrolaimus davidi TaxID=227884 RepID=A0A914PCM8_9BILA
MNPKQFASQMKIREFFEQIFILTCGTADATPNGGTFNIGDSKYGFSQGETGTGKTRHRTDTFSLGGIGTFEVGKKAEQGAGIANFLDKFIPKIPEPPGGIENSNPSEREEAEISNSNYYSNAYSGNSEKYKALIKEYEKKSAKAFASKTSKPEEEEHKDIFKDDDEAADGFIEQGGFEEEKLQPQVMSVQQLQSGHVPLSELGLKKEQVTALCQKFSVIAAQVCYGNKIEPQYLDKCRGYQNDCAGYISEAKPLGAIANSFNSGVGITYFNVGVNGIPYYAVNEEGAINAGHNGKVDFGSWGGGYSDTIGVKDYWRQTAEAGANWYEGLYGYKTGWHVPIVSQFGVEGGGGTHVHVPLKEGSLGQPIQVSNGYHVGPYLGLAENVGVDWYNGGVSASKGFALPIVGVNGNAGTSVGFPSLGTVMRAMGPYMG